MRPSTFEGDGTAGGDDLLAYRKRAAASRNSSGFVKEAIESCVWYTSTAEFPNRKDKISDPHGS